MILRINFKTPDAVHWALQDNSVPEKDQIAVTRLLLRWIRYGESIDLEVDTEKETIKVLKQN